MEEDDHEAYIWYVLHHDRFHIEGSADMLGFSGTRLYTAARQVRTLHTADGIKIQEGACNTSRAEGYSAAAHHIR